MKATIHLADKVLEIDLAEPHPISIPIKNGDNNPNCYYADPVKFEVIKGDNFIGSVKLGGVVNHQKLTISTHGNGTHTECYGHITDSNAVITNQLQNYFYLSQLIDVTPTKIDNDSIITKKSLEIDQIKAGIKALVVRTLPNTESKLIRQYSGTNPTYFAQEAIQWMVDYGIEHLITDLPSVDKEVDGGRLVAHKTFWQTEAQIRSNATITELAYMPDSLKCGLYILDLQILALHMDASPSNPVLYKIENATSLTF